jgi:hypothetical protein
MKRRIGEALSHLSDPPILLYINKHWGHLLLQNKVQSGHGGKVSPRRYKPTVQSGHGGKEAAARSSKRGLSPISSKTQKRSQVQDDQSAQQDPEEEALSMSQNKSSKGISKLSLGFGASDSEIKRSLVNRGNVGRELNELVLNVSVSTLLDNSDISEKLSRFLTKVKLLPLISVKLFAKFQAPLYWSQSPSWLQTKAGHTCHIDGLKSTTGTIDLLIADMPEGLYVPGLSETIPVWNSMGDMYSQVFKIASRYLDIDGALLLLTPIGMIDSGDFVALQNRHCFDISLDWICLHPLPLAHPNYRTKQVDHSFLFAKSVTLIPLYQL